MHKTYKKHKINNNKLTIYKINNVCIAKIKE